MLLPKEINKWIKLTDFGPNYQQKFLQDNILHVSRSATCIIIYLGDDGKVTKINFELLSLVNLVIIVIFLK